ncbi:hypothetical protein LCGC14_2580520, partial [marine sediment metagenome]
MTIDKTRTPSQEQLPFQFMTLDILSNALTHADNPGKLSVSLTHQLRDLTGASSVVLVKCLHGFGGTGHEIMAVCPERREELFAPSQIDRLAWQAHDVRQAVVWTREHDPQIGEILGRMNCRMAAAVPLNLGETAAGVMLLFDLPEAHRIGSVLEALEALSPIIAVALRYSAMYREQETIVEDRTRQLSERVRELNCLYAISGLVEKESSLEEILRGTVDLLHQAWRNCELACVRLVVDNHTFVTDNFADTPWKLDCAITTGGDRVGTLEVRYLRQIPPVGDEPFLPEEKALLTAIAKRLGRVIEHKQAENALRR